MSAPVTLAFFPSLTRPGVIYLLTRDSDGRVACSCPSMTFSRGSRPCKHLTGLARLLADAIAAHDSVPATNAREGARRR